MALVLLAGVGFARARANEVAATTLDGKALTGELRAWANGELQLVSPEGAQTVPAGQLLTLRWTPAPASEVARGATVELTDGTLLPIDEYSTSKGSASVALNDNISTNKATTVVPLRTVRSVRLLALAGELASQWEEIRNGDFVSDVLVVLKREGKSLDYVEGIVGDVTEDKVAFELDGDSIEVDRSKVGGILYYRDTSKQTDVDEAPCVLKGRSGLRARANEVALSEDTLAITTLSGLELSWSLEDIYFADFSAGKLAYLSDLEVAAEEWTPLVGLPASVKVASDYGRVRRDESAYGGRLSVRHLSEEGGSARPRDEAFDKGLAIRSRTELIYRLPADFSRFLAVAGIEPATSASGDVLLTIDGDGRRLLETQVGGDQAPQPIELDIAGVKRLNITVDYGQNLDTGDWLNLCNARLVK